MTELRSSRRGAGAALVLVALLLACGDGDTRLDQDEHTEHGGGGDSHEKSDATGANGGKIFSSDGFELELGMFERGTPPEYRAWASQEGRALEPGDFELSVELARLGGRVDRIAFAPRGDHLVSTSNIAEPHSFEVSIVVTHAGTSHGWQIESFEGRTQIDAAMSESLGVATAVAGPATLLKTVTVYGRVRADPEHVREIRARFDGVVRSVQARTGDRLRSGEALLRVESNESLKSYTITAPMAGVITQRDANPGEQTAGRVLMTITDTSKVWIDLSIFPVDREGVVVGSPVELAPALGGAPVEGVVSWIGTEADPHAQTVVARVALENAGPELLPGTFVTAHVEVGHYEVPLAVERIAIQTFRDSEVVYARFGDTYEVRMIERGREAGGQVEVLGGLDPGTTYVTANSHLIKADIEKSGAAHHH
jgi:cobalt-zinc-cadmium efflux system membrane fusion protein